METMKWSNNNRACLTLWTTLIALGQLGKTQAFDAAGDKTMNTLTFFGQDASTEMKEVRAKALALQMDGVFRLLRGAVYETGVKAKDAVKGMTDVLTDATKTVSDLADAADDAYKFFREGEQ
jgi:hypothetical protein